MKIVVVEDEPEMRRLALDFFNVTFGEVVSVEAIAPESVFTYEWEPVLLAVVDLMMPIPGTRVLRYIRDHYPHIYRVAWTAYPRLIGSERKLADDVVPKLGLEELELVVTTLRERNGHNLGDAS